MTLKKHKITLLWLLGIFLLGLWLRLSFVETVQVPLHSDMRSFHAKAMLLLQGSFGTDTLSFSAASYRPPGYPLFLASVYQITRTLPNCAYIAQAFVSSLAIIGTYLLAILWAPSTMPKTLQNGIAITSALLIALSPTLIGYSGILLSETLFITLLLTALILLSWIMKQPAQALRPRWLNAASILCGIVTGYLTLTRSVGFSIILVAMAGLLYTKTFHWQRALLIISIAFVTIAPWTIRNYLAMHRFVLVDNASGINMVIGNNDLAKGSYTKGYQTTDTYKTAFAGAQNIADLDKNWQHNAKEWILQHPARYGQLFLKRIGNYFASENEFYSQLYRWEHIPTFSPKVTQWLRMLLQVIAIFAFLTGMVQRRPAYVMLGLCALYFYLVPSLCLFYVRYRHPALPFIAILGIMGLTEFICSIFNIYCTQKQPANTIKLNDYFS